MSENFCRLLLAFVFVLVWYVPIELYAAEKDTLVWTERVTPGPAVTLRLKRIIGKALIYDGTLDRSQQSANSYTEKNTFLLNVLTADKKDVQVNDVQRRLDLVAIWRTYTDRQRTEIYENGKKVQRALENSNDLINLGPNFEMVGTLRCYGLDGQNSVAFATQHVVTLAENRALTGRILNETKDTLTLLTPDEKVELKKSEIENRETIPIPHVIINETPHYLFPIFSQREVAPGDTWKFRLPVIVPIEQGNPPRLLPTQFTVVMVGRLREVQNTAEGKIATVDYQVSGEFDTSAKEFATRFPEEFTSSHRISHKISGSGTVCMDVEKGRILSKSETFKISLYALGLIPQGVNKEPKRDENQAEIQSDFNIHLLPPGSTLKNGSVIPEYENLSADELQKREVNDKKEAPKEKKGSKESKKSKKTKKTEEPNFDDIP